MDKTDNKYIDVFNDWDTLINILKDKNITDYESVTDYITGRTDDITAKSYPILHTRRGDISSFTDEDTGYVFIIGNGDESDKKRYIDIMKKSCNNPQNIYKKITPEKIIRDNIDIRNRDFLLINKEIYLID